jgi:hypothetical protein
VLANLAAGCYMGSGWHAAGAQAAAQLCGLQLKCAACSNLINGVNPLQTTLLELGIVSGRHNRFC